MKAERQHRKQCSFSTLQSSGTKSNHTFEDNSRLSVLQKKIIQYIQHPSPIQRTIEGLENMDAVCQKFFEEKEYVMPEELHQYFQKALISDQVYSFEKAFQYAMEEYSKEDTKPKIYKVQLSTLIDHLDPTQHTPKNVSMEGMTIIDSSGKGGSIDTKSQAYKREKIQNVVNVERGLENEYAGFGINKQPILITSIIEKDQKKYIRTSDGRHRIAAYHAMDEGVILAEINDEGLIGELRALGVLLEENDDIV